MHPDHERTKSAPRDELVSPARRALLRTFALGGMAAVAGCMGGNDDSDSGTEQTSSNERSIGGEYVVGDQSGVTTLNWLAITDQPSADRVRLTLDTLYTITPEKKIFPLLAKEITTDDERIYTVTLRDNLKWGAGYGRMTAEDWVYEIRNIFQAEENWTGYTNRHHWFHNGSPIPVEMTGELRFEIRLPEPDPEYLLRPGLSEAWCMPKALLRQYVPTRDSEGLNQDPEINELAYTGNLGPYTFERSNQNTSFVAQRNEEYYLRDSDVPESWSKSPYYDSYTYRVIPDQNARLSALQKGNITSTSIPLSSARKFQGMDDVTVQAIEQPYLTPICYNMRRNGWSQFRKQSVRRAFSYAVDKNKVAQGIFRGFSDVTHTFQPRWSDWYDGSEIVEMGVGESYDIETARSKLKTALQGAGYAYDDTMLKGPDGSTVTLKLVITQTSTTIKTLAQYLARAYGKLGFNIEIEPVAFDTLTSNYLNNSYQGSGRPKWNVGPTNGGGRDESVSEVPWDLCLGATLNTYPLTPSSTEMFFTKRGRANYTGYYPKADLKSLYDAARSETDEKRRRKLYAEIFGTLSEEQPYNFVITGRDIYGYRDTVHGSRGRRYLANWNSQTWYRNTQ